MRHWTLTERRKQAEMIGRWKPWKTGGVKTPGGKAASCRNAMRNGAYSIEIKAIRLILAESRDLLKMLGEIKK
jgi:hypothetical protein